MAPLHGLPRIPLTHPALQRGPAFVFSPRSAPPCDPAKPPGIFARRKSSTSPAKPNAPKSDRSKTPHGPPDTTTSSNRRPTSPPPRHPALQRPHHHHRHHVRGTRRSRRRPRTRRHPSQLQIDSSPSSKPKTSPSQPYSSAVNSENHYHRRSELPRY